MREFFLFLFFFFLKFLIIRFENINGKELYGLIFTYTRNTNEERIKARDELLHEQHAITSSC